MATKKYRSSRKASGIARSDLFITSKLDNQAHTYELATQALDRSLSDLQTDYLDLFLIHWPNPKAFRDHDWEKHLQETWRALEDAYTAGKVKAIGVSNFKPKHFEVLKKHKRSSRWSTRSGSAQVMSII